MLIFWVLNLSVASAQERERPPVDSYDLWSEPNPGVRYLKRVTTAPVTVHVLELDLRAEGIEIVASSPDDRWSTVAEVGQRHEFAAAINGGFWHSMAQPGGMQVADGELWETSKDDGFYGYFGITTRGRAIIREPDAISDATNLQHAVSARPMLIDEGEVTTERIDVAESANRRQPRTAVGIANRGRRVWLLVTDGRQEHSVGMTLYEVARMLQELGAERAINLDGGGSSTIYVAELGGVINAPSGGRWEQRLGLGATRERGEETGRVRRTRSGREMVYVRGVEREVMNVLGVRAPPREGVAIRRSAPLDLPLDIPEVVTLTPRAPTIRLGIWREWIVPLGCTFAVFCMAFLAWRVRRRLRA
ncbi:MAG: phosphodiester glycosidase family protein [Myxococcota bacterium]